MLLIGLVSSVLLSVSLAAPTNDVAPLLFLSETSNNPAINLRAQPSELSKRQSPGAIYCTSCRAGHVICNRFQGS